MQTQIPFKITSIKPKDICWFDQTCKDAVRCREEAFKVWRLNPGDRTNLLRKQSKNVCNKSFRSLVKRIGNRSFVSIRALLNNDHKIADAFDKINVFIEMFPSNSNLVHSNQSLSPLGRVRCSKPELFFRTFLFPSVLFT